MVETAQNEIHKSKRNINRALGQNKENIIQKKVIALKIYTNKAV